MVTYLNPLKCSYCSKHSNAFVRPEIPHKPRLIVVGEGPGRKELEKKRPFVGPSGQVLRSALPADAIIINATNVFSEDKPTTEIINAEREAHLLPLLADYPDLPIVSLGAFAAQALLGGKRSDSSMAGEALWIHNRPVLFTYHPAYYLRSGKDERILHHIAAHLRAAIAQSPKIKTLIDEVPGKTRGDFVLDIEATGKDLPFYGTKTVLLGIMAGETAYQYRAAWLAKEKNRKALQVWLNKQRQVIGHGILYDILHGEATGLSFEHLQWYDTMIALKDKGHDLYWGFGLKGTARNLFYAPPWEAKFHETMRQKLPVEYLPLEVLSPYNAADLYYTKRLAEARSTDSPITQLDMDYLRVVKQMVVNGLYINQKKLAKLLKAAQQRLAVVQAKARRQAHLGKDFNFNSPKQVLPVVQQFAGREIESTKEQVLMTVFDKHPFIATLLKIRGEAKTAEMLEEIKARIAPDGLIHAKMTEHGAETSRTTSKEPNIQNWAEELRVMLESRYGR